MIFRFIIGPKVTDGLGRQATSLVLEADELLDAKETKKSENQKHEHDCFSEGLDSVEEG